MDNSFPDSLPVTDDGPQFIGPNPDTTFEPQTIDWLNDQVVKSAFQKFKDFKAPGTDGIQPYVLKHLPDIFISRLRRLYEAILASSYTPSQWRESKAIFLPKLSKANYTYASAFRPISLTPFFLKG